MKKISTLLALVLVLALAVPAFAAEDNVKITGESSLEFKDIAVESDSGNFENDNVFTDDDDVVAEEEEDSFKNTLTFDLEAALESALVSATLKAENDMDGVHDDSTALDLDTYNVEVTKDDFKVTVTDSLNPDFNEYVLPSQDDPYTEGVVVENKVAGVDVKGVLFQETAPEDVTADDNEDVWDMVLPAASDADLYVYGVEGSTAPVEGLTVGGTFMRTKNQIEDAGPSDDDEDASRNNIALTAEYAATEIVTLNFDYATTQFGSDVENWDDGSEIKDTNLMVVGGTVTPIEGAEATVTYKDVQEDYSPVKEIDYDKGFKLNGSYELPVELPVTVTPNFTYSSFDDTRSSNDDAADDNTVTTEFGVDAENDDLTAGFTYTNEVTTNDDNDDLEDTTTTLDLNLEEFTVYTTDVVTVNTNAQYKNEATENKDGDVTGDETTTVLGVSGDYQLTDVVKLTGGYDLENRTYTADAYDEEATAKLATLSAGVEYTVATDVTLNLDLTNKNYTPDNPEDAFGTGTHMNETDYYNEEFTTNEVKATLDVKF